MTNKHNNPNKPVAPIGQNSATLHLVQSSRPAQRLANWLIFGLFLSIIAMAFLPWQQTSRGTGQVVAFVPQEREQSVQSPVKGVVQRIADGLVEGSEVKKGDFIVEIQPFAANMVDQLNGQLSELKTKEQTAKVKAEAYEQNIEAFGEARDYAVSAAMQMIEATKSKLKSKKNLIPGYQAKELQARLNYDRQRRLFEKGAKPAKEAEKMRKEWDVAKSETLSILQDVEALKQELASKKDELEEKRRVAQTKIDYARALQQDALGAAATARKEVGDVEMKLGEMSRLTVTAPKDGTIFRLPVFEQGQALKAGDTIMTLVPEVSKRAVELLVNGNDLAFVQKGQEVQLQFESWPAVQIAGWPSLAIGTFTGTVANVDSTDNGKGQFRILVTPDETDRIWPDQQTLRQGVRVNGWVVLRKVRLGFEIWRQLNGFPVILDKDDSPKQKLSKPPKIPK